MHIGVDESGLVRRLHREMTNRVAPWFLDGRRRSQAWQEARVEIEIEHGRLPAVIVAPTLHEPLPVANSHAAQFEIRLMPATSEWQRVGLWMILLSSAVLLICTVLGFLWIQAVQTVGIGSLWFMMIAGGICVIMMFVQGFARVASGTVVNGQKLRWISGDAVCFIRPWMEGKKEIGVWVSMLGPDGACIFQFRHSRRGQDRLRSLLSLWCADKWLSEPERSRTRDQSRHSVREME